MSRFQWLTIGGAAVLFSVLYFGLDTIPPENKEAGSQRRISATNADVLIQDAVSSLSDVQLLELEQLETGLRAGTPEEKQQSLESLSRSWYQFGHPVIAGHYAMLLAEEQNTDEAWSIAGSTFAIALQRSTEEKVRDFSAQNAVRCFESAISLNPDELSYRLNLALVYAEKPVKEDPMKGILMLRDLNQKYPENVSVLNNLARLGLQTGQVERALQRLESAYQLEPKNPVTVCLLAEAYRTAGDENKAGFYTTVCKSLRN